MKNLSSVDKFISPRRLQKMGLRARVWNHFALFPMNIVSYGMGVMIKASTVSLKQD